MAEMLVLQFQDNGLDVRYALVFYPDRAPTELNGGDIEAIANNSLKERGLNTSIIFFKDITQFLIASGITQDKFTEAEWREFVESLEYMIYAACNCEPMPTNPKFTDSVLMELQTKFYQSLVDGLSKYL